MAFRALSFIGKIVAALALCAIGAASASEVTVVRNVLGPEGPLFIDGNLYFVAWNSDTLSKWDGKTVTVLNHTKGCGHNGLALTKQNTFLLACTAEHGAILELDRTGKQLHRWDTFDKDEPMEGGINDVTVAPDGGAYATVFGNWSGAGVPTEIVGKVLYMAPGSGKWIAVARDLNFANGVGVSPDQKTLYVSETVGNCILKFTIEPDGTLSHRSNFALLNLLTPNRIQSWSLGPDSMKIDPKGNMYVAQWSGGKVLKLSPAGKKLHEFDIAAGTGTTNIAFGPGGKDLYITVAKDFNDSQARGSIVKIPNVE